jgi:predicted transcriptional regulator
MNETTTVRVQSSTRDRLRKAAKGEHVTVDTLIRAALDAYEWSQLRKQATSESLALLNDPEEQRAAREINAEMASLRAW